MKGVESVVTRGDSSWAIQWGINCRGGEGEEWQAHELGVGGTEMCSEICKPLRTRTSCEADPEELS